jgi:hypothetical protein
MEQFTTEARCVVKDTLLHLPEMIGEAGERGDLHTDQRKRETMGLPKQRELHGNRGPIVPKCLG